jgi:hypothetical protein
LEKNTRHYEASRYKKLMDFIEKGFAVVVILQQTILHLIKREMARYCVLSL